MMIVFLKRHSALYSKFGGACYLFVIILRRPIPLDVVQMKIFTERSRSCCTHTVHLRIYRIRAEPILAAVKKTKKGRVDLFDNAPCNINININCLVLSLWSSLVPGYSFEKGKGAR